MNIEEAKLYLEHTSKDDFNLEEWQNENRYQAIQVVLEEIERLNNIINKIKSIIYNSIEYNALTKVALIRESLQGSDKE